MPVTFSALDAEERARRLCDPHSVEIVWQSRTSALLLARGRIGDQPVALAFTDGRVRGGTVGTEEATTLASFLRSTLEAAKASPRQGARLVLALDTGGVRVEEGPRALAATAAAGVLLAEWSLVGPPAMAIVSGPRGCFGALSVMAALPDHSVMTDGSHWGLTGPKLFPVVQRGVEEKAGFDATSAAVRQREGLAAVVSDSVETLREELSRWLSETASFARPETQRRVEAAAAWLRERESCWRARGGQPAKPKRRRRGFLRYSFRHQWQPREAIAWGGLAQAAWGRLGDHDALGIVVGPAASEHEGIGIAEAALIVNALLRAFEFPSGRRAAILNFVFCQAHVVDLAQEQLGLPKILAECLRAYVATRLVGHKLVSVLGGGTYGAAYLALAAPSERILALRGTRVAPMAPAVFRAFEHLRGKAAHAESPQELAEWIPEVHLVDSVVRLPRALAGELKELLVVAEDAASTA